MVTLSCTIQIHLCSFLCAKSESFKIYIKIIVQQNVCIVLNYLQITVCGVDLRVVCD